MRSRSRRFAVCALTLNITGFYGSGFAVEPAKDSGLLPENRSGLLPRFELNPAGLFAADSPTPDRPALAFNAAASESAPSDAFVGPASFLPGTLSLFPPVLGQGDDDRRRSYVQLRAGPLFFIDDFEDLDTGLDAEVAYGFHPIPFLILEVYSGYFWGEENNSVENRLQVIPLVGNVKVAIPLFIRPYAGVGAGGFYILTEQDRGAFDDDEDDLVLGWNAMIGVSFNLGPVLLSGELKYLMTDSAEVVGGRAQLEGLAVLVGAGVRF